MHNLKVWSQKSVLESLSHAKATVIALKKELSASLLTWLKIDEVHEASFQKYTDTVIFLSLRFKVESSSVFTFALATRVFTSCVLLSSENFFGTI